MRYFELDQNTQRWFDMRLGVPTASGASNLVTTTLKRSTSIDRYANELAQEIITGTKAGFSGSSSTDRGHMLEPMTADFYEVYRGVDAHTCGFFMDDLQRHGASPDLVVGEIIQGGDYSFVELKNHEEKAHNDFLRQYKRTRKNPKKHLPQLQMQMFTGEAKWVDLVLHHPELECLVFRYEPDNVFQELLDEQINLVIYKRDQIVEKHRRQHAA